MYTLYGSDPGGRRGCSLVNVYKTTERGIEMGQTTMRIPVTLKEKLETIKRDVFGRYSTIALYDVVESIISENERLKQQIADMYGDMQSKKEEVQQQYIHLGEELKSKFKKKQDELALKHDFQLMKVLLDHFESSGSITKYAFETYVRVREGVESCGR